MTKLEQKLIELGYKQDKLIPFTYNKKFKNIPLIIINNGGLAGVVNISRFKTITTQEEIDNLQQAFNEMQKDLEVLKQCQD